MEDDDVKAPPAALSVCGRVRDWAGSHPLFLIALSALGFATQGLFVKLLVMNGEFGSFEIVLVRGLYQASGVALVLTSWGEPFAHWLGKTKKECMFLFMRGFFGYGGIAFAFLAIQMTSLANAQVAAQTTPVFSAILGHAFLSEKWLVSERLATLGAIIGVTLVFRPPFLFHSSHGQSSGDVIGIIYSLLSSLCAAVAYMLIRYMGTTLVVPWPKLMLAQAVGQFTLSIPLVFLSGQSWVLPSLTQMMFLSGCGVLGFLSQVCMTMGMQRSKSSVGSLFRQTGVVYSFLYQLLLVPGEGISISTYIGAAVITFSVGSLGYIKSIASEQEKKGAEKNTSRTRKQGGERYTPVGDDNRDEFDSDLSDTLSAMWSHPKKPMDSVRSTLLQMVPRSGKYAKLVEEAEEDDSGSFSDPTDEDSSDEDQELIVGV